MSQSHTELIALHMQLLPFFVNAAISRQQFISAVVASNPEIPLGGLPLTPKDSRYAQGEHFLPTRRFAETDDCQQFIDKHAPIILKPVYGAQSRNVSRHKTLDVRSYNPTEPMLVQKYADGKEFAICVDRTDATDCYSIVEIDLDTDVWNGTARYHNHTDKVTPTLVAAIDTACKQADLEFGRLDVRSPSLKALQSGEFRILEINGGTAIDLRLYTNTSYNRKLRWLREHWQRLLHANDVNTQPSIALGLLFCCLLFTVSPLRAVRLWNYIQ